MNAGINISNLIKYIPFLLYFPPPAMKHRQEETITIHERNLLDECAVLKRLAVVFLHTVQGHAEDTVVSAKGDCTFHTHVIALHERGVAQWAKGKGAALAASVKTPIRLLSDCEGYVLCDV